MATAPQVQSLADVMTELNPAFAAQEGVIQQRQAGLGQKYDAQRAAITAEKGEGFNAINNQATGRGMSFSGIPIDEQARYLSTKYLPGLQQATYQQNEEDLNLQGELAKFGTQKFQAAFDTVNKQKSDLNSWNMQEASIAAQAEAARLQRDFTASQNDKDRALSAANSARANAGSTSGKEYTLQKQANGGYTVMVDGKSGVADLATYAKATGTSVLSLLAAGSQSDKNAYKEYVKTGNQEILRQKTGAFYLGGGF